jgi:hypothetical protein
LTPAAHDLLNKLFERWQRAYASGKTALPLVIDRGKGAGGRDGKAYFSTTGNERASLHATLENAASFGAIRIEMGSYAASHEVKRIHLVSGEALGKFLDRRPAHELVDELAKAVYPILDESPKPWVREAFDAAVEKWRAGQSAFSLRLPDDHDQAAKLFRAISAVIQKKHEGLDLRTFSAKYLDDSKFMERYSAAFAEAWRYGDTEAFQCSEDLYERLGLQKAPWLVMIKGPLILHDPKGASRASLDWVKPFMGIPGYLLATANLSIKPKYVMTIENLASFVRHCQEIKDQGLVIFTNGFPAPVIQAFIARLNAELSAAVPFVHWGDTDVRGLEILSLVAQLCPGRVVGAHLMDRTFANAKQALSQTEKETMRRIASRRDSSSTFAQKLIDRGIPVDFEQENIDPLSPNWQQTSAKN